MSEVGRIIADRYRIDSVITESGPIGLYRGTNILLERPVVIKLTNDPGFTESFLAEAKRISHINDPNVLEVSDFGPLADESAFAIYEDFDGETLSQVLIRQQLPVHSAVNIAHAIASGTSAASVFGVVRPSNVLIHSSRDDESSIKLFNFSSGLVGEEAVYAAPETIATGTADERSDVYSLGLLTWRMLAGEMPHENGRPGDAPPAPLSSFRSDIPAGLEAVVLKAMSADPDARQQTLAEFSNELSTASVATSAAADSYNIWKTAFVVLAGITLLAAALIYATSVKQTDPTTQLQTDANGQPVQPINPATGIQEQSLANIQGLPAFDANSNANIALPPGTLPGGDGYDPWRNGGAPPPGAPPIGPAGRTVTIDPNTGSPFMPPDTSNCVMQPSGILLCPVPLTNTNTATKKPTPTPKNAANANTQAAPTPQTSPSATPAANRATRPNTQRPPAGNTAAPRPTKPEDLD